MIKTLFVTWAALLSLEMAALSQTPPPTPSGTPTLSPTIAASVAPSASVSPSEENDLANKIHRRIDARLKQKGLHFTVGSDDEDTDGPRHHRVNEDVPEAVIPLVAIVFLTIFGAPVLIVAVIMYFGFSRNRMMHRTIRMMVEKGQPVPPALLAPPPPAQRQRSDMRRGVVLVMVGLGLMLFLAAVNDWEGGMWALGIIPFLIGAGYLLVWKLEGGQKPKPDNPPPLP
jgi:Domain of unknown function (DUF6249)